MNTYAAAAARSSGLKFEQKPPKKLMASFTKTIKSFKERVIITRKLMNTFKDRSR
jgi:hypothetical protein